MKKTLLNTALANMTGALALTIMFGSGMALATEVTLDETLQYNEDSRNVEAEKGSQAADNGSWNESNEAEAENGGQAATNHGKNIDIEIDTENKTYTENKTFTETKTEVEAEKGSQAANNGSKNISFEHEVEAEKGGQIADDGSKNVQKDADDGAQLADGNGKNVNNEVEAEDGGQAANNGSKNVKNDTEVEAEKGSQAANNGGVNNHDESFNLSIGDVAVALSTQELKGSAAFVGVKARYHVKTGDINAGHNQMKLAAGNFAVSENTGIGSVANSANLQSVIGTVTLVR